MNPTTQGTDCQAALLTAPTAGAIAVIGLWGPGAAAVISRVTRSRSQPLRDESAEGRFTLCRVVDETGPIDEAVIARRAVSGQSFFEINLHGGTRIVRRVMDALAAEGAQIMDAAAAPWAWPDGVAVERAVDRALLGVESRRLTSWLLSQRRLLPDFLRQTAAMPLPERDGYRHRTAAAIRLLSGLRVALVGPPNAGKSTLANRLIGRDRVIVSDTPGTTRDWVSETALICGWPVTLIDTAGIRAPACEIEREAIRRGASQAAKADIVVIVLDASVSDRDTTAEELLAGIHPDMPRVVVRNKCDLIAAKAMPASRPDDQQKEDRAIEGPVLLISARTGLGIERFERSIESLLNLTALNEASPTGFLPDHLQI